MLNSDFLYFSKTKPDGIIPSKRTEDAGYDVYACFEQDAMVLQPGEIILVPAGIASAFSDNYVLIVKERSSTGKIGLSVRMGVIDSGYRGEIHIGLNNTSKLPIVISKKINNVEVIDGVMHYPYSKAIAQMVLCTIPKLEVKEVSYDELLGFQSERKAAFLGASGK